MSAWKSRKRCAAFGTFLPHAFEVVRIISRKVVEQADRMNAASTMKGDLKETDDLGIPGRRLRDIFQEVSKRQGLLGVGLLNVNNLESGDLSPDFCKPYLLHEWTVKQDMRVQIGVIKSNFVAPDCSPALYLHRKRFQGLLYIIVKGADLL